jgi:non-ribosomal peptide synthetase component F
MIAGLNVLVYKITGTGDVVVGAHAAIRDREEIQDLPGFFVNTLLVRNGTEEKKRSATG